LQASCFLLSEAAAWLVLQEATLARVAWLSGRAAAEPAVAPLLETGRRALTRCALEAHGRLKRFDAQLALLRRGIYSPAVRAASLLFQKAADHAAASPAAAGAIDRPLSVLVVIDAPEAGAPQPHVADGRVLEAYRVLTEADRAALEAALRLRDAGAAASVQVATVAPPAAAQLLREALSLGVERVHLVTSAGAAPPDRAAAALAAVLHGQAFDLVLTGDDGQGEEGVLGRLTAEALGVPVGGSAAQVAVRADGRQAVAVLVSADGGRSPRRATRTAWPGRSRRTRGRRKSPPSRSFLTRGARRRPRRRTGPPSCCRTRPVICCCRRSACTRPPPHTSTAAVRLRCLRATWRNRLSPGKPRAWWRCWRRTPAGGCGRARGGRWRRPIS
jgi:hypothetical protein